MFVTGVGAANDVFERGGAAVVQVRGGALDFAKTRGVPGFATFPSEPGVHHVAFSVG